jgi:ribosomal-protein-alanine N-acetyltransferase
LIFSATRFPGFNDGMVWDAPATPDELRAPLERNLALWESGESYTFSIDDRRTTAFMGRISIRTVEQLNEWDIGYWLHPDSQGRGYMREAAAAVLRFGFIELDAQAIHSRYAVWNEKSGAVLFAIGMKLSGYLPRGLFKGGNWVPEYKVSITRQEWCERCVPNPPLPTPAVVVTTVAKAPVAPLPGAAGR